MSQIIQRQSIFYGGSLSVLRHLICQLAGTIEPIEGEKKFKVFNNIEITIENKVVTLEVSGFSGFSQLGSPNSKSITNK